ncbi:restriction modification system DNA specificity domain-containing protein [[Clostridium] sordellii]|uniref:restriction endonuclease subunit S n=1 Tax=Paraclostridium sordellii TaxID=1505 RepID=UPI0005DB3344|nr:restriction endonuclease subunit S [Paeniclostridium sordellii]CEO06489.1 restriction modification system DNA specificity domain-containing protein [[Clostridium] sordellii] [Paeniclostridium sordellii]CEQ30507.1 restriction modification system DNA specificity domain-containing protein [[Clostridium] sordellii] [Paeniclostridium sordellii]
MSKKLPEGWEKANLKDYINVMETGKRPKGGAISDGIPSLGGEHINYNGQLNISLDKMKFIPEEYYESLKSGKIEIGDILIVKDGATTGKVGIVKDSFPFEKACINEHLFRLRSNEYLYQKYLYYYLRSDKGQYSILKDFRGATVGGISKGFINMDIVLPPLEEQKRIVSILEKAEKAIQKRKESNKLLDELVKSRFIEMFGELKTNENNFEIVNLEQLTTKITDGVHCKPEYTSEGIPFISVKDINKGKLNFSECKYISKEAHEKYIKRCNPEFGDILYTKVGATYGIPAVVDTNEEFSLYVSVALLKLKNDYVNPIYIKEALRSIDIKRQADRQVKGIGVPDLHLVEIKKFKIFNPPIELQNQFADFVKQVDKLKFRLEISLKKLESNFNSLMQKAFNGEL